MSPQQALHLLDQMVQTMRLTRAEHQQAVKAVQVISSALPAQPVNADPKPVPQ